MGRKSYSSRTETRALERGTKPSSYAERTTAQKVLAFALAFILTVESLFNNGVSTAFAETLADGLGNLPGTEQVDGNVDGQKDNNTDPGDPTDLNDPENATEPGDPKDPGDSSDPTDPNKGSESSDTEEGDGDTIISDPNKDETPDPNTTTETEAETSDPNKTDTSDSVETETPDPNTTTETETPDPNTTETDADPVEVETWDWTGKTDNLTLSSPDGLAFDTETLKAIVEEAQATADNSDDEAEANTSDETEANAGDETEADSEDTTDQTDNAIDQTENNQTTNEADATTPADVLRALLSEQLDATVDLTFQLNPSVDDIDTGNHTVVLPGDSFTVTLPEGMTISDQMVDNDKHSFDIFHSDEEGNPTTLKIAEGTIENEGTTLKVTFVEPVDPATGSAYYVGTPTEGTVPAADAAGKQQLEKIDASVALEVSVSSALLTDEASELGWTLQTSSADETVKQETVLALPGLGELAAQLGIEAPTAAPAGSADPAPVADDPAPQADLTYKPAGNASGSASLTMNWYDNNDSDDKRPEADTLKESLSLTFSLDDGDPLPLNEENAKKYFGMDKDDLAKLFSVKETGVGTYTATASGLYTQVEDSNGTTHTVTWTLSSAAEPDGYYRTQGDDGSLNFQLLATSTYTIVAKVGEEKLSTDSAPASDFVVIDGSSSKVPFSAVNKQPGWTGTWDAESGTYKLTAPAYGLDGLPIEYGLAYAPETPNPTPGDGYTVTYDNAASANHGSSTTAVYDGGTATILRVGTTTFTATKQWLDAGDKQGKRPKDDDTITFTLWRYSSNGDTAANAAQVTDAAGNFVTLTAKVEDVTKNNAINLGALLADQYPGLTLEKYDNDGYAYYYGIREESSFANYTTVYGSVADDGQTATDTAPNYTDKSGKLVYKDGWTRDTNVDRLIYNNGSIGNRLSGQKTVEGEKEWHVAAFADQLNGVSCTFTLQSRVKGDENAEWTDTTVTKTLTDFTAETLTKDFSGTYDLYDLNGNELEYRWIETGVEQKYGNIPHGGTNFTAPTEGEDDHLFSTFTLFLRALDEGSSDLGDVGEYEQVVFTSETWVDENGVSRVRNTFDDTVDETVSKSWAAPNEDGELADLDPGVVPKHNLTISIYDGDVKVAEAVMDGTVDADTTPVTLVDGIDEDIKADFEQANPTYQETTPDHLEIKNLPRYKSDGSRYNYRIVEGTKLTEWNAQTYYDPDTHETTIVNMPADGTGANVALEKDWVDGGDSSHRLAVEIEFYAKEDITKDGETVYAKDEILPILILGEDGNLKKVESVTITEDDTWFRTAMIMGVTDTDLVKVGVRETRLVSSGADGADPASYEVLTYDEARKKYEDSEQVPSWVNTGWGYEDSGFDNAHLERVSTGEHVYEVSYKSATAEESPYELPTFYVSNRRIGLVNISIEKTWKDGATKADERPNAVYRISCDDPKAVFAVDDEGRATVKLNNGNTLPLFEEDPDLSGEAPRRLTGSVDTDENGRTTLLVSVPTGTDDENTVTTGICGLPKYDGNGTVVSYSVTEEWADDDHAGYASSLSEPTYATGVWHFKDTCTYTATNSLVGSRDVVFFKEWNDAYIREGAGQRPDINLTLYRVSAAEGSTPQKVTGYISWRWEALKDANGDVSQYQWKATAPNLATYDANGYAYTYYAVENIPTAAGRLDYQPVTFRADTSLGGWSEPENVKLSATDLWNVKDAEKPTEVTDAAGDESGSAYAMREGGTFVNTLENTLRVNGRKIWRNIPGDASTTELPQILVLLQRRYVGEQDWPAAYIEKTEKDGKVEWSPTKGTVEDGGVIAWTDKLDGSETTYNFTIVKEGDNNDVTSSDEASLPRYDADGRRYEYRAVEVVTGLIGTPALSEDEVKGVNVAADDSLGLADDVYAAQHGAAGSFVLRNTYAPEQGNLTVKKIVDGARADGDTFPAVTFTLYRYDPAGDKDAAEKVDEVTITSFESNDSNVTGTAAHTFKGLDVFTPNGEYWRYYVVEKAVDGYDTAVGLGDLEASSVTTAGRQSPDAMSGDASLVANNEVTDITFRNTYVADADLTLDGAKRWDDLGNAFGTRPNELTLTLRRKTASQPEETITLNEGDNLTWTKGEGADTWTYKITGLEQWAPDGTAWTYTVTEKLADGNQAYRVITGSAQKQGSDPDKDGAYTGTFTTLENRLAGSASVRKSWAGDNNDEWGLRPASVTVELQAQTSSDGGTTWSVWGNAKDVLTTAAGTDGGITAEQTLKGSNWSYSWDVLPYQLSNGTLVQYRVVETKVGDTPVANPTDNGLDVTYPLTESYIGEGKTTISTVNGENNSVTSTSTTTITNTLDATELTVKKVWDDDGDKWGLRDKVSGSSDWTTTFYLQRSTDGITWEYVTKEDGNRVKSVTVTGAKGADEAVRTFGCLPAYDKNDKPYCYRAVEVVPGGYALIDTVSADGLDEGHATVAGDSTASTAAGEADQTFTNKLETITLSGEKAWNTFGATGLVPGDANSDGAPDKTPTLALERTTAEGPSAENATWENVTAIAGQPAWRWGKDSWKWTYDGSDTATDLPKYDGDGKAYTYRVSEAAGSVPGFYPTYEGGGTTTGPATVDPATGDQTASTITNVATRFSLNKVSDYEGDTTPLCNVELSVMSTNGATTYAVWTNGADGKTPSARVWMSGTTVTEPSAEGYAEPTYISSDGSIIGLPAGDYLVRETGVVPDGYALAPGVTFHINADGGATQATNVSTAEEDGVKTIAVKVTDPVFRGHVELAKTVTGASSEALAGAEFELWRKNEGGTDEKIATGITTGDDGKWASKEEGADVEFLTYEDGKREHLSDGLLPGIYYFREVDSTPGAWLPSGDEAKYEFTIESDVAGEATNHQVVVNRAAENEDFSATVVLHKVDATDPQKAGIDGVTFTLSWKLEDGTTGRGEVTTASDGTLTLSGLKKGNYTLKETKNTGYDMTVPFEATFTIDNEDYDAEKNQNVTFNVVDATGEAATAIEFTVANGTYDNAHGITNERLTGKATLTKTDDEGNALKGATFSLQTKGADGKWADVEGKTNLTTDGNGQIAVDGLAWGTYRFVETTPADGYVGHVGDKPVTSDEFTIDRDTVSTKQAVTAQNAPTRLKIKKVDEDGAVLKDEAVFTIDGRLANGKNSVDVATEDGVVSLDEALLIAGETYTLTEKAAPAGYELAGSVEFAVDKNGDVADFGATAGGSGSYAADKDADGVWTITATDRLIDVRLQKDGDATLDGATNPYTGAEFTITPAEGDAFADGTSDPLTKTTDANGAFDLTGLLVAGETYRIEEAKAPAGYELIEGALVFEVNADGTLKVTNQPAGYGVSAEDGLVTIKATDPAIRVALAKVDEDGRALPGAVFTVAPKAGTNTTFANGSTDSIQVAVDENTGKVSLDDALLVAGGTYTLTETVAPNGHEVAGWVDFTVDTDGTVTLVDPDEETAGVAEGTDGTGKYVAAEDANGTVTITATDLQTEVTFLKVSTKGGAALPGAEFTLAPEQGKGFASTSVDLNGDGQNDIQDGVLHVVSDGQGQVVLVGLLNVDTDYTLTETKAPAGYELSANPTFTFDVAKDGTISPAAGQDVAAQGEEGFSVANGTEITLTIADEPIEAKILKQDKGGETLKGASFTLSGTLDNGRTIVTVRDADDGTEDGIIEIASALLVAGEDYTIEEIVAPDGHEVAGKATLHVNDDGTITVQAASDGSGEYVSAESKDGVAVITVKDEQIALELEKVGTDDATNLDATFTIKPVTGSSFKTADKNDGIDVTPSTAADRTRGELLKGNTYTITEKNPADGYQLNKGEFAFTVNGDGTISAAIGEAEDAAGTVGYRITNNGIQITATDAPIEAQVVKHDENGGVQSGAVFSIAPAEGSKFAKSEGLEDDGSLTLGSTNANGVATIPSALLVVGNSYTITEVTAPDGYELAGSVTFTVSADGFDISIAGAVADGSGDYAASVSNGLLTITATDEPVEISLAKQGDNNNPLVGAEFSVTLVAGNHFANGSDGAITGLTVDDAIERLSGMLVADQSYELRETKAPAGYELIAGSFTFTVLNDGTIEAASGATNDGAFAITNGGVTVTATDEPVEITLNKVSSEDEGVKLNATFELTGAFASDAMDGTAATSESVKTVEVKDGSATLTNLVAGNTYELRETISQNGYEVISGSLTFEVDEFGAITPVGTENDDAFTVENGNIAITAENTPIKISLEKQDLEGNPLTGAEFTLEGDFTDGSSKKTVKSGDEISDLIVTNGKDVHEYTLTETKAPDGYELIQGGLTFTLDTDGTVSVVSGPTAYEVGGNEIVLVAKDTPIEVKLRKIGEGIDDPLSGAVFEIFEGDGIAPGAEPLVTLEPTDDEGYAELDAALLVQDKTYTIREVTAPENYELAGTARFKVNEDGTITFLEGGWLFFAPDEVAMVAGQDGSGKYGATADGGVAVIVASDSSIAVQLQKNSEDDSPLSGATFELTDKANPASAQALTVNEQGMTALPGLVAGHTYTLIETVAPAGYELNTTVFEFTVNADGTITAAPDQAGYSFDGTDVITVTATDAPIEVTLNKADLAENALNGAVFSLSGTFANENGTPGSSATRELTLEDNTITIDGLIATREGAEYVYTLTETTAPEGYELLGEFRFTVDEHGAIHAVSAERAEGAAGYDVSDDGLAITAHDQDIQINLSKQDSEGNALDDAAFELVPAEGSHFADGSTNAVSATPGTPVTGLVADQTYVLTETVAPAGYEAISGSFTFTVGADGTIAAASAENDPAFAVADDGITIVATDAAIEVGLVKLSADGTQLAGASFSLVDTDDPDTELATITSTAEGTAAIPGLVAGKTYVLTETGAPAGYELAEGSFTFTVGADGTISVPDGVENGAAYSHANRGVVTVTVTDQPVEVQIEKLGENSAPLTGATFSLAPAEGSTFTDGSTEALTLSTTDGLTSVVSAQLVAGQTYVLTETAAPAGYELIAGSFNFTVNADGTLAPAAEGNAPAYALGEDAGVITITATDEPVSIELSKTDLSGNALEGAEFTLTGIFANADGTPAAEAETRTVPVDGTTSVSGLITSVEGGTVYEYQLVETVAPAGFELIDGTLAFTVDAQGNLVVDPATVPAGYVAESGTVTVTAQDTPAEIVVAKQSESGEALEGAEFTLSGTFADGTAEKDVTPGTPVTGLIAGEKYVLTETVAPAGYEKLGSIELTVAADGTVSGTGAGYEVAADGVTVVATDIAIEARVAKVDENGKPLAGAAFTVAAADDPADTRTVTTGEDGTAALDAAWLVAGRTYTITETAAPAGFELAGSASFTVAEDGTVSLVADDGSAVATVLGRDGSGSYEATVDGRTAVITAADTSIAAQLVKVTGSTPLAGAEFELAPAEGSAFADGSTDARTLEVNANGLTALNGLVAGGTYVLRETVAPAGYELIAGELTFTVGEDGTLAAAEGAPEAYAIAERGGVITIVADDAPIEVTLNKADLAENALNPSSRCAASLPPRAA